MATTSPRSRAGTKATSRPQRTPAKARKPKPAAKARAPAADTVTELVRTVTPHPTHFAGKGAWKLTKFIAKRVFTPGSGGGPLSALPSSGLRRGAQAATALRARAIEAAGTSVDPATGQRPPIQVCTEVAAPLDVVWEQWMLLRWLPEGVDSVIAIDRGGDGELSGRLHRHRTCWSARILDERERESFAWESTAGSDCAGLITFHRLSERLTRVELSLDIRPTGLGQAAALTARRADRRARADLRRFKARVELISPDAYPGAGD